MRKSSFFFNKKLTLANAPDALQSHIETLKDLYDDYRPHYEYFDVDSLAGARNAIKAANELLHKAVINHRVAFLSGMMDKVMKWKEERFLTKDYNKINAIIEDCQQISKMCQEQDNDPLYEKASSLLEKAIKILIAFSKNFKEFLNLYKKEMQKQGFFSSREDVTVENAPKVLSQDVKALNNFHAKYEELSQYLNMDVLKIAIDKIESAITLLGGGRFASRKTALLGILKDLKQSFDIHQDIKAIKNIIKNCIDTRNIYYNSADPKKVKASKELQKAVTILMDFSEDLKKI